ncbi:restriction endonuclease subunit S [Helicobacter pylori]|uniref:restriction endonuclease subunit S n=1 Tax=Helicobacter pylori TaxID=210 RepID=UPI0013F4775A|nr:restriction endonuclease subunit S [Helicobacter pylori]NHA88396.1 restriction endonuclease subunit S [Helicobacter pylori]
MNALMLPSNWQRVRLGDIAEIKRGIRITKNELDVFGKYPVVSGGVGFLGYTNNFNRYENTITIAQYGTAGYVNFQKNKFWANDICFCVYPNKDVIKNIFLYYFLKVNQNYLYEISNRNATPYSISKDKILDFEILLPPLNEQIAIANILSDVDHYLYSLDALILKKESVKKALSFELLSQRKRLKGFNQNWQRVRLGDILSYEQPTKFLVATTQYLQKGFTPILTAGKTFILGYTNDKHGIYTNIPVIIFDDFTTDSKMVNFPFKVKSSAIKILSLRDNNQADLKYIYEKLTLLKHQVTDHKRYWIDEFSNIEILLPPLNEQIAIANILSDVDHEIISLKNKKRQFENIKKALNHDLMSAKIRVLNK